MKTFVKHDTLYEWVNIVTVLLDTILFEKNTGGIVRDKIRF